MQSGRNHAGWHLRHREVPSAVWPRSSTAKCHLQSTKKNHRKKSRGKIPAFCVTGRWHGAPRLGRRSWITLGQEGRQRGALRGYHAQPRGVGSAMQPLISAAMHIRRGRQSDWPPHPPCPRSSLTLGRARQGPFRRGPARRHRPGRARPEPVQAGPRSAASHGDCHQSHPARIPRPLHGDPVSGWRLRCVGRAQRAGCGRTCTASALRCARASGRQAGQAQAPRRPGRRKPSTHQAGQASTGKQEQQLRASTHTRVLAPSRAGSTHIRATRTLHPGTARRRQAGQAPQSRSQAGKQARRQASSRHAGGAE